MDKNELTEFLKKLKSALHKRRLDRKLLDDLQFEFFTDIEEKDLSAAYGMLSTISEGLDEERSKELEWYFIRLMSRSISSFNNWTCPYFLQKKNSDIKLPFKTWDEELSAVASYGSNRIHNIEIDCFRRCCRCREIDCPYRIICPDKDGPYWRKSEYEQQKQEEHQEEQEQPPAKETSQQKAARTRIETNTRILHPILPDICKKLKDKSLVITDRKTGKYEFLGTREEYAYFAVKLEKEMNLSYKPWDVLENYIIPPETSRGYLKKVASYYKNNEDEKPSRASDIDSAIAPAKRLNKEASK